MSDPQTAVRILHLEDSPRDAARVADLLDAAGICREIVHVTDWKLFEEALEQSRYDLILCAFSLPGFDGLAALKLARERRPEVPVIVVSGAVDPEEAVECMKAGAIDYLLEQRLERLPEAVQRALEQTRANKRCQEGEEHFRQLVDHSSEGFWLSEVDPEAILYVSPGVERIAGVSAEHFYQDANAWMLAIHPADRSQVDDAWVKCVQGQAPRFQAQYRIIRPDGSMRWILDSGTPIRDETGKVVRVSGAFTDVTERTQAESRLSESEERFRQLAENVHDIFWLSDPARTHIFYISPAYETVWGRTCASLQASPRQWIDDIHPEDRPRVLRTALSKQTSGSYDEQFRIVRPDGAIRWIDAQAFPVKDQSGAIYRIAGVARDITERRMAAAALQEERDRLRQILDSQFGFVVELSLDGAIVEINQMPLTLAGLSREEVMGRPVVDIGWVQPDSVTLVLAGIKAAAQGETMRCDVGAFFPGLGLRDVDAIFSPRRNAAGEVISVLGFGVDITERKLAEQVVRESEEKFSIMFGSAPFAICLWTLPDGVLHEVNRAWLDICGFTRKDEVLGKTGVELGLFPDETARNSLVNDLLQQGSIQNAEVMIRARDGTLRSLLVNIDPVTIRGRQFALAMMADITESKQTEAALRTAQAREAGHATMLASVRDAMVAFDLERRIHYWNAGAERLYGWTAGEVLGRRADEVFFADLESFPVQMEELVRTGEWHGESPHRTKDGREIVVESFRSLLVDEAGQPSGVIAINTDITTQKQTESVLQALSTEVAGLTDEAFFQFIVRRLAEMLGVEFGVVGRLDGEGLERIQTLALWAGDRFAPNIIHDMEGSPC